MSAQDDDTHRTDHGGAGDGGSERMTGDGERTLDAKSQTSIEERLRTMYDRVVEEPVPDRFLSLLEQLESSEGGTT